MTVPESHPVARTTKVAVVTGTRADFGLLRPVMHAVRDRADLELLCIAAGAHLILPAITFREVKAEFDVADSIPMQIAGRRTRADDAEALGRGISRFTRSFGLLKPDWVLVLGDRIEAFAAASAASVAGLAVAHIHGGDRAEGVADEAMRHAITKLAHLHCAATEQSAERIRRMGEKPEHVHVVGSPAIDDLARFETLSDERFRELGEPEVVFLMHPIGTHDEDEQHVASVALDALAGKRVLALAPNQDPGRAGVMRALEPPRDSIRVVEHLPRSEFIGLLRRITQTGALVGNSSAGLIEAAALKLPVVDIGPRQAGRERPPNVVHASGQTSGQVSEALARALALDRSSITHPYGDGHAGVRIATLLSDTDPHDAGVLRKRCAY